MSAGHTPTPWVVNPFRARIDCARPSKKGGLLPVAQMLWPTDERSESETEANADLICRAVNAHDELVEALRSVDALWSEHDDGKGPVAARNPKYRKVWTDVRLALSKALGNDGSEG